VNKTRTLPFFLTAFGITWVLQLPAVLAQQGWIAGGVERFMPLASLGIFGPLLGAVLVSLFESRKAGVRALFRPLRIWRVGASWYLIALGIFAFAYVTGRAVYGLLAAGSALPWLYPPENAQHLAAMVVVPIGEEPGWRGFALPRMQRRFGALAASLYLGVAWALWHTMMFVLQGATIGTFLLMCANILAGSVVFGWLYNRTRGSLLIALIAHLGSHLNNPTHALPGQVTPFVVYTIAIALLAVLLVGVDRNLWRRTECEYSPYS
jgi:membrane protease YdiL (CAAX protease family)